MKRLLLLAGSVFLILSTVFAAFGTLTSAFHFSMPGWTLLPVWFAAALILSAAVTRFRVRGLLLCLIPILAALIWKQPEILAGAKHVLFFVTNEYNKWIDVPVIFPGAAADAREMTLFWGAAGLCLIPLLSIAVCMRRSPMLMVFFTLPVIFPAFVVTEFPPSPAYPVVLLAVLLVMLFCSALHPDDFTKRGLAVFPALALAIPLLATAYLAAPPDKFIRNDFIDSIDDRIREIVKMVSDTGDIGVGWPVFSSGGWRFDTEHVEIAGAGKREVAGGSALEVVSSRAGTFYLRGYSMQMFDGRAWQHNSADLHEWEEGSLLAPAIIAGTYRQEYPGTAPPIAVMTITKTGDRSNVRYFPYYVAYHTNTEPAEAGFYSPEEDILALAAALPPDSVYTGLGEQGYSTWAQSAYTQISGPTAEAMRRIAEREGINALANRANIANQVAKYVSSAARYTLSPPVIPDGEDFALYFLQTSRRGYCIHFATAAVLMLRALDVPARFTSGFVVTVAAGDVGRAVTVTDEQAHAWVEVYYDDIGWIPLEVTPASRRSGIPARVPHTAATESPSPETTPPAEPGSTPQEQLPSENPESTPSASPSPAPSPSQDGGGAPREAPEAANWTGIILLCLSCTAVCGLLLILRGYIVRKNRVKGFGLADTNASVLCAWRYICRLSRRTPPEEIEQLAMKARFSQHRISEDERTAVILFAVELSEETLGHAGLPRRLWMKYVRGL